MGRFLLMPKLGMTMETGKIVKWMCSEGDNIEKNDPYVEVETDKVNLEVESLYEGVILKLYYSEGDEVPVTKPKAYLGEAGDKAPDIDVDAAAIEETAAVKEEAEVKAEESVKEIKKASSEEYDLAVIGGGPGG